MTPDELRKADGATQHYVLDTGYACGRVVVRDGAVVDAAPIFRWMIGHPWQQVHRRRGWKVEELPHD